jgi:hypothetical protein
MARVSVEVPEELVEPVRETVLLLYQATAESLHQALRARPEGESDTAEAHSHRARIDELDELARALGAEGGDVVLTASRDLLHDTLYGALIDAGERLAACRPGAGAVICRRRVFRRRRARCCRSTRCWAGWSPTRRAGRTRPAPRPAACCRG